MAAHYEVYRHDVVFEDLEFLADFDTERKARFYARLYSRYHPGVDLIVQRSKKRVCAFRNAAEIDPIKLS